MRRLTLALLLAGCGDRAILDLPALPEAIESWVIARVGDDGQVRVEARDRAAPAVSFPVSERVEALELRAYERPLAALDLSVGPVLRAAPGERAASLPEGDLALHASLDGVELGPWSDGGLEAVAPFQRRLSSPCLTITATITALPVEGNVLWTHPEGDGLLIGTSGRVVAELRADGTSREVPIEQVFPRVRLQSGFTDARGRLWLGSVEGGVWRGELSGGMLNLIPVVPTSTANGELAAITGDPEDPEGQLFVVSLAGFVAQVREGALEVIDRHDPSGDIGDYSRPILWLGRDHLMWGRSNSAVVRTYRAGVATDARLSEEVAGVLTLRRLDGDRVLAGLSAGHLSLLEGGEWRALPEPPITLDIRAAYPLEGGFLYAGSLGYVAQWDEAAGFCPVSDVPIAANTVKFFDVLGGRLVLTGNTRRTPTTTPITFLGLR